MTCSYLVLQPVKTQPEAEFNQIRRRTRISGPNMSDWDDHENASDTDNMERTSAGQRATRWEEKGWRGGGSRMRFLCVIHPVLNKTAAVFGSHPPDAGALPGDDNSTHHFSVRLAFPLLTKPNPCDTLLFSELQRLDIHSGAGALISAVTDTNRATMRFCFVSSAWKIDVDYQCVFDKSREQLVSLKKNKTVSVTLNY